MKEKLVNCNNTINNKPHKGNTIITDGNNNYNKIGDLINTVGFSHSDSDSAQLFQHNT